MTRPSARRRPRARLSSTRISLTGATGEHGATVRLDVPRHRVRQLLAAALRDGLAVHVDRRNHDVERLPRAFLLGQDLRGERPVEHDGLDEVVLEVHLDPGARRERELLQAPQAGMTRLERTRHRRGRRGRREERLQEAVLDEREVVVDPPIALGVALRVPRDARAGLVDRAIDHDAGAAVAIRMSRDVIRRRQVAEAVRSSSALDRLEVGVALDPDVRRAVQIVPEAGQGHFLRDGAAADPGVALDDAGRETRARERGGTGQARSRRHRR